ncbi:unnamed protein product [Porites evermanni]|uniref:Homeobox domain-containing protein n=1 Tax=Porites evermanni TaxID=104178 RepID=A0ABN8MMA5_9CNID|nr:unnamed protein product [Porites evermanni]
MQPTDHTASSPWSSLSQNWFRPTMNSSFYAVQGMSPDSSRNINRLTEHMMHSPTAGERPTSRMPQHLNALPHTFTSSYYPSVNSYYSISPGCQEVGTRTNPYHVLEHGGAGAADVERLNQLFEKTKTGGVVGTTDLSPRVEDRNGLRYINDKIIRPQRGRTVFSAKQLHELEKVFVNDQYISGQQRRRLSSQLGLTETQVRVWFQNRRIKWRKQKLERKVKA